MRLTVEEELYGLMTIFHFHGSWDNTARILVDSYLEKLIDVDLLIFDFTHLESIDSTFHRAMLNAINVSHDQKFTLTFKGLSPLAQETYLIGGTASVFADVG
jgi:hypothetical protein